MSAAATELTAEQLLALNARLEADLRELRDQGVADARELTSLREKNSALNEALADASNRVGAIARDVEHLYLGASMDLERHADRFNAVRRIREQLDPAIALTPPFTTASPRLAAVGVAR